MNHEPAVKTPGVAVIGAGYWGQNLVRNYHQLGALVAVCDKNETVLAEMGERYAGLKTHFALHDVLAAEEVKAVVVATPAETHFALTREALLAGKHVQVEKPLVLYESEAEELIALAEEKALVLMVGHLLRYHPAVVRLNELAAGGELGRINYIYSHRLNLGKIRREENILWSFAPHDVSMILSLAGEEPESVLATGGNYLHKEIADVTTTHLDFPSGLKAHIFVSWLHPFKEQKLVVVGERKMAVFDDTKDWPDKLVLYPHRVVWERHVPVPAKAEPERMDIEPREPLRLECEHFISCIATGARPLTDGQEALKVLKVLRAGQRSLDSSGTRIMLSRGQKAAPQGKGEPYFVHPSAVIDEGVGIGPGTKIWHFSHVMSGSRIGGRCNIGQNVVIGPEVHIGDGCKIQNNVSVYPGVTLEEEVFCGPSMVFTNVINPRAQIVRKHEIKPTLVRRGATLGANATVVCGVRIGRFAFVGAGAVVTKDVADHALVKGNPARQDGWICSCGVGLGQDLVCPACGLSFRRGSGGLEPDQSGGR